MTAYVKTSDLYDTHGESINIAASNTFRDYGGSKMFSGKIVTVNCFEDNPLVKKTLEESGDGKVLVIDGGASMQCALLGDMLGEIAVRNKWNGIIINGCIRDSTELSKLDIGVKALGTNPRKSKKTGLGEINVPVNFAGVAFTPGEYVYCDEDGIVVSESNLA
jgi:regulator of ribonuclease activity A